MSDIDIERTRAAEAQTKRLCAAIRGLVLAKKARADALMALVDKIGILYDRDSYFAALERAIMARFDENAAEATLRLESSLAECESRKETGLGRELGSVERELLER